MKTKHFKRIKPEKIAKDFSNFVTKETVGTENVFYDKNFPPHIQHTAAQILAWWIKKTKATLRKKQMVALWRKIVSYVDSGLDETMSYENNHDTILKEIETEMEINFEILSA